jgi:hypothetical protein
MDTHISQQTTVRLAMSTKKTKKIANNNGDEAKRGPHKPEVLKRITGISQTNYDSWRRALEGAPSKHFSDGDILGYAVIQTLILVKRVHLPVLRRHGATFIFEVCNYSFDALKGHSIMFDWTKDQLIVHSKSDPVPDTHPYDLAVVDLDELMLAHKENVKMGFNKNDKTLVEKDVFDLARLRKTSQSGKDRNRRAV